MADGRSSDGTVVGPPFADLEPDVPYPVQPQSRVRSTRRSGARRWRRRAASMDEELLRYKGLGDAAGDLLRDLEAA